MLCLARLCSKSPSSLPGSAPALPVLPDGAATHPHPPTPHPSVGLHPLHSLVIKEPAHKLGQGFSSIINALNSPLRKWLQARYTAP